MNMVNYNVLALRKTVYKSYVRPAILYGAREKIIQELCKKQV